MGAKSAEGAAPVHPGERRPYPAPKIPMGRYQKKNLGHCAVMPLRNTAQHKITTGLWESAVHVQQYVVYVNQKPFDASDAFLEPRASFAK